MYYRNIESRACVGDASFHNPPVCLKDPATGTVEVDALDPAWKQSRIDSVFLELDRKCASVRWQASHLDVNM